MLSRIQAGPNFAKVATLIGDPGRARMLFSLLDGREFPASELAYRASVSPQAASAHLHKLVDGGLLFGRSAGRQRLYRLASAQVAAAIETLASIAPVEPVVSMHQHSLMERLREARSCYDHLAGKLGVGIADALLEKRAIAARGDTFALTARGERFLAGLQIDVRALHEQRRTFLSACLDWTERRRHVAGSVGAALMERMLAEGWVRRNASDRALQITNAGRAELPRVFGPRVFAAALER
jgi:DNA-binding transcriptional ArsR family regulator